MDDLISRQALCEYALNQKDKSVTPNDIMRFPSAQPEPHWIPCSERLPNENGEYRITWATSASKKRFVGDSEYEITSKWDDEHYRFKGEWLLDDYIKNYPDVKVIAWKPIEEPYKGRTGCNTLPSAQPEPIKLHVDHALTEEEIKSLKQKIADSPIVLLPSAQPERKKGKWIEKEVHENPKAAGIEEWQSCKCSVCGRYDTRPYSYYFDEPHYCSWCGADMRGEQDEET